MTYRLLGHNICLSYIYTTFQLGVVTLMWSTLTLVTKLTMLYT